METPESPRRPSPQDQRLAAELTRMERSLEVARDDAEVQAILGPADFDPPAIDAILALVGEALKGFTERATAMGTEDTAFDDKGDDFEAAQKEYATFRKLARARFIDDPGALTALGLDGRTPRAFDTFVGAARASYAAAAQEPYVSTLGRGYTAERLDALLADIDALVDAAEDADVAEGKATASTRARNARARAARKAYAGYRDTARALLSKDLLRRINLD